VLDESSGDLNWKAPEVLTCFAHPLPSGAGWLRVFLGIPLKYSSDSFKQQVSNDISLGVLGRLYIPGQ